MPENLTATAMPSAAKIREKYELARRRVEDFHIRTFEGQPGPIFLISTTYPGVWLEHAFDAVVWARLNPGDPAAANVARNQMLLFLRNQKEDGRLPFNVLDPALMRARGRAGGGVGYSQIQECVAFARLCLETYELTRDRDFLLEAYEKCARWDAWLVTNRMTQKTGLIELFCLYDTGHDNSARLADIPVRCPDADGKIPAEADAVPMLAPDMNAVFYGDRTALAEMAAVLGRDAEAQAWREKAEEVRQKMLELLYDPADEFFYDRDRHGQLRKFLSISITNVFTERVPDQALFDRIYERHMKNPAEFWSPYPFPSLALSDPGCVQDRDGNSWGFYAQGLTALRGVRWMDAYGRGADYDHLLRQWVSAYASDDEMLFAQELHPVTGALSKSSEWYSSAMLLYMYAVRRLGLLE